MAKFRREAKILLEQRARCANSGFEPFLVSPAGSLPRASCRRGFRMGLNIESSAEAFSNRPSKGIAAGADVVGVDKQCRGESEVF